MEQRIGDCTLSACPQDGTVGLGEVCLDFLGDRGISSTLACSLSLFGFALATQNGELYL